MRALLLIFALGACSVPVKEFKQSMSEGTGAVIYAVTETAVLDRPRLRPVARPTAEIAASTVQTENPLNTARQYLGYNEVDHRTELKEFLGVDPKIIEWCAGFVNSALHHSGLAGSESVSVHPLLARSFVAWGEPVDHQQPQPGDVVVFPRGRQSWQGHVGFYVGSVSIDDREYWQILGGNQNNSVSIELYPADRAIAVRRLPLPEIQPVATAHNWIGRVLSWVV